MINSGDSETVTADLSQGETEGFYLLLLCLIKEVKFLKLIDISFGNETFITCIMIVQIIIMCCVRHAHTHLCALLQVVHEYNTFYFVFEHVCFFWETTCNIQCVVIEFMCRHCNGIFFFFRLKYYTVLCMYVIHYII